jgi:hypothetical protein
MDKMEARDPWKLKCPFLYSTKPLNCFIPHLFGTPTPQEVSGFKEIRTLVIEHSCSVMFSTWRLSEDYGIYRRSGIHS